jgi:hypothetical protein
MSTSFYAEIEETFDHAPTETIHKMAELLEKK